MWEKDRQLAQLTRMNFYPKATNKFTNLLRRKKVEFSKVSCTGKHEHLSCKECRHLWCACFEATWLMPFLWHRTRSSREHYQAQVRESLTEETHNFAFISWKNIATNKSHRLHQVSFRWHISRDAMRVINLQNTESKAKKKREHVIQNWVEHPTSYESNWRDKLEEKYRTV